MLLYLYAVRCSYTWRFPYDRGPTPSLCGTTTTTNIGPTPPAAISLLTPPSQHTSPTSLLHTPSGETLAGREESRRPRRALLAPVPRRVCTLSGAGGGTQWDRPTVEAALRAHTVLGEGFLQFEVDKQLGWPAQGLAYVLGERVWLEGRVRAQDRAQAVGERLDLRAFHNGGIGLGSVGLDLLTRELD